MVPSILVAGLDGRSLQLEAPLLQRTGHVVDECPSARTLLASLPVSGARLVVLGPRLPDVDLCETIRRIRSTVLTRRVSVLALIPAGERAELDGHAVAAGANAVLRRPLDPARLENWLAKLLVVPRRVEGRVPVQAQVVGTLRGSAPRHFEGHAKNLSVHGMLLASPVSLSPEPDLEFEFNLPPHTGLRALGRVVREAKEVMWPYLGYGIEFLFLPTESIDAIVNLVATPPPPAARDPGEQLHSTVRREAWVYEIHEPMPQAQAWYVEIRRAPREAWRPGGAGPFYVVEGVSPENALAVARDFVKRYG